MIYVMTDSLWALSYLSDGDDDRINACVQTALRMKLLVNYLMTK